MAAPTCERCGGRMKLLALVKDHEGIARYLPHLGEPIEPPPLSPASAPPYFQSRVLRRRPPAVIRDSEGNAVGLHAPR